MKQTGAQVILICALVFLFLIMPVDVIDVRDESGSRIFCASGDTRYLSRNSIYGVTVSEAWAIDSGVITIVRVSSTPIVLDYYGIESYRVDADGTASGAPKDLHYNEVRMKVTARGEQLLVIGNWKLEMSKNFEEGTVLIIKPRRMIRIIACVL
ncbi:MAG: hypothetical protein HZC38_08760 [Chloroflexi bacterium]|nr:hypothetical protein [Chloroflexota bacterium]MBI5713494.1 hypothetical protein [Chloroflexota bacterium]